MPENNQQITTVVCQSKSPSSKLKSRRIRRVFQTPLVLGILILSGILLSPCLHAGDQSKPKKNKKDTSSNLGWKCNAGPNAQSWDCDRTGPISEQLAISEKEKKKQQTATISASDEIRFQNLVKSLDMNPWQGCQSSARRSTTLPILQSRETSPFNIDADYVENQEREITTFQGNVDVTRADQRIKAHFATYDAIASTVLARDDVYYKEKGLAMLSDTLFLNLQSHTGKLRNALFVLNNVPARALARVAYFESMNVSRYEDAAYTTCEPGNLDWSIHAEDLRIDREQGWGIAQNAWLEFMDVPFLYTPYMSFPLDDRRKSGFLAISLDSSKETGFGLTVPYYWNIAPNFDATIAPRFMSNRGFMLGGEFRYLIDNSRGEIAAEVLTYDIDRSETRGQVSVLHQTVFSPELRGNIDAHFVSDDDYLDQLGNTLGITNRRHIRSRAGLNYTTENLSFIARVENYQTIDDTIVNDDRPYRRLPQLLLNTSQELWGSGLLADFSSEFVFFHQSNTVTGQRLDIRPSLAYPIDMTSGYVHPKVTLAHTRYWYSGLNTNPVNNTDYSDSSSRTLPIASLDASLFLEQDLNFGSKQILHKLQPRLFYVYIPHTDQSDIPLFDSDEFDFSFFQMFRENRFSGGDRIGDTNHLTAAFTSSFYDADTGRERLRVSIGEIFYFQDRKVSLFGRECVLAFNANNRRCRQENDDFSNLITEIHAPLTDTVSVDAIVHWDPISNAFRRRQVRFQYLQDMDHIINVGYLFRNSTDNKDDTLIDQLDGSFRWAIVPDWSVIGRMQYSFHNDIILDSFLGVEHDNCCWRFRILGRHFINDFTTNRVENKSDANNAVFVQLELKGLASFGNNIGKFMERHISGYRANEF